MIKKKAKPSRNKQHIQHILQQYRDDDIEYIQNLLQINTFLYNYYSYMSCHFSSEFKVSTELKELQEEIKKLTKLKRQLKNGLVIGKRKTTRLIH